MRYIHIRLDFLNQFLDGGFYLASGSLPVTRFFCTLNNSLPEMEKEHRAAIAEGKPAYLVVRGKRAKGLLKKDDPTMLAFAYTAPISALIHLCDREPEKTEEALKQIESFSRHFIRSYSD